MEWQEYQNREQYPESKGQALRSAAATMLAGNTSKFVAIQQSMNLGTGRFDSLITDSKILAPG